MFLLDLLFYWSPETVGLESIGYWQLQLQSCELAFFESRCIVNRCFVESCATYHGFATEVQYQHKILGHHRHRIRIFSKTPVSFASEIRPSAPYALLSPMVAQNGPRTNWISSNTKKAIYPPNRIQIVRWRVEKRCQLQNLRRQKTSLLQNPFASMTTTCRSM